MNKQELRVCRNAFDKHRADVRRMLVESGERIASETVHISFYDFKAGFQAAWNRRTEPEWQPIETVPRDASVVLVYLESEMVGSMVHAARFGDNGKPSIIGTVFSFDAPDPTHWKPLPATPNSKKQK